MQARTPEITEIKIKNREDENETPLPHFLLNAENFVLGGGGAAGLCEVGAIRYLQLSGYDFKNIKRVAGSSVGGPGAVALATHMASKNPQVMFERLGQLNFKKLLDIGSRIRAAMRFYRQGYVCAGDEIKKELSQFLKEQTQQLNEELEKPIELPADPRDISFRHFRRLGCKELFLVTTPYYKYGSEGHGEKKIWCHLTTPDASVFWVLIASMALPYLFNTVTFICDENNQYHVVPNNSKGIGIEHGDGGIVDNLLLELFDDKIFLPGSENKLELDADGCSHYCPAIANFEKPIPDYQGNYVKNPHTFAIAIYPLENPEQKTPLRGSEIMLLPQACVNGMLIRGKLDYHIRHEADGHRLAVIPSPISTTQFDADEKLQHAALMAGANSMAKKFNLPAPNPEDYILPKPPLEKPVPSLRYAENFLMWGNTAFMSLPDNDNDLEKNQDADKFNSEEEYENPDEDEEIHLSTVIRSQCLMM